MPSRRDFLTLGGLSVSFFGFARKVFAKANPSLQERLKNLTKGVPSLTPEDIAKRREKVGRLMVKNKIDGLFLTGSTDLIYFTGVSWGRSERTFGALLNPEKSPIWVCPSFELKRARELIPTGHEIRTWEEDESPYKLIAGIMRDLGSASGHLALGPTVRNFVYFGLRKDASRLEIVNGAPLTQSCRSIKTTKEIQYMELANRITKLAYKEGFKHLREGMTQAELSGLIRNAHQKMGAAGGGWPQYGPNSAYPHGSRVLRSLHKGDVIVVDGGCSVEGFRSDVTRTIVFGKPTDKQKRVWEVVHRAQQAALKAVRPGRACEDIDRAARKVIEEAGYGAGYKYFPHRVGHGIGMDGHEYPYLVKGNKLKLEPGMTFSDEPGIYIYGEFGVRVEDCFVVTETGGRFLGGMESASIDEPFRI